MMGECSMKLTVLVDNNTFIDQYYLGEPAACFYLEAGEEKILFDAGYSDVFLKNACSMGIDLTKLDRVVISHGHNDHTGGLRYLSEWMETSQLELIAHPETFWEKEYDGGPIGAPYREEELRKRFRVTFTAEPYWLAPNLLFLGEIPSYNDFEPRRRIGWKYTSRGRIPDLVMEDSALAYIGKDGLFVITGCSHSGICNMIEHARKVTGIHRIAGVLGGFHLFQEDGQLESTITYLENLQLKNLYPSHCVSFKAKAKIHQTIPITETGVGMTITL